MKDEPDSRATRASLLGRLAGSPDDPGWTEFDRLYHGFFLHICREMGLSEEDAQDIRQEVMADLVKKLPDFTYDPGEGKFRSWLRQRVRWKVWDHAKRNSKNLLQLPSDPARDEERGLSGEARDESAEGFERLWEREWEIHLLELAKKAVKQRVTVRSYQVYDLLAVKELPVKEVSELFGINENNAYKIRHDVEAMLRQELTRIKEGMG